MFATPTLLGNHSARNEEKLVITYSTKALEQRQWILQPSSRSSMKKNISATWFHFSQHILPRPGSSRRTTLGLGFWFVTETERRPPQYVGGERFRNLPRDAPARSWLNSRHRKLLRRQQERAGRRRCCIQRGPGFLLTDCFWETRPANLPASLRC